ncbi:hypothetical protein [Novosphingobium marinum]|uniref:Uncharacterized protein n=1 Tax=Novosphingobium marinum TaxID=1514948 RepID=A0A7Y9XXG8_9SPHN|nr:hypothetical protein [Novosphingobium marinum]NYH96404.1 hypothetical protein [Novosphingobium marinum]
MSSFSEHFGWVEIVFTGTVALGFGFYQLWSINREIRRDKEKKDRGSAGRAGHAVGEHELDDR